MDQTGIISIDNTRTTRKKEKSHNYIVFIFVCMCFVFLGLLFVCYRVIAFDIDIVVFLLFFIKLPKEVQK